MRPWILKPVLVIATGLLATGCGSAGSGAGAKSPDSPVPSSSAPVTESPSPTPTSTPSAPAGAPVKFSTVTVTRTGGFAGFNDQYTVAPNGALTIQTKGVAAPATKKLAPADLAQLKALLTGPALAAEAKRGRYPAPGCRDGFEYSLAMGSLQLGGTDCGGLATAAPTFWKIVQLVEKAVQTA